MITRWFSQGKSHPLNWRCTDSCDFPKCGKLDCIASVSWGQHLHSPSGVGVGGKQLGMYVYDSSVRHYVVSDSLWPHELLHTKLPCPSLSPKFLRLMSIELVMPSNHLILCRPLLPPPSIFPSIRVSQFFASGGQSIGASASASVLLMTIQDWFPSEWTGFISLQSKGLPRVFSNTTVEKHQFFSPQPSLWFNSHVCTWLLE